MRIIRTLATAALCTAMIAGPNVTAKGDNQAAGPDDGEPQSTVTVTFSDPPEIWAGVFDPKPTIKLIEIKPGKSLEQQQQEETELHQRLNDEDMARQEQEKEKEKTRELSPAKAYDRNATIIMSDGPYRDALGRSNCVAFATKYSGIHKVLGYGVTVKAEGTEPQVGAIALDRYRGHAAVVVAISGSTLTLWDSNWIKGYVTERKVDISSQRGYIYK